MEALSQAEKAFVHGMMSKHFLDVEQTALLYSKCHGQEEDDCIDSGAALDKKLADINKVLEIVHIEFRKGAVPPENTVYWGIVSSIRDSISKQLTLFTDSTLAVFFILAKKLLSSDQISIDFNSARNISMGLDEDDSEYAKLVKVMRPSAVEESLKKLEEKDWLRLRRVDHEFRVSLGVRCFLELPEVKEWGSRIRLNSTQTRQPPTTAVEAYSSPDSQQEAVQETRSSQEEGDAETQTQVIRRSKRRRR